MEGSTFAMATLFINHLRLQTIIGTLKHERVQPQPVIISMAITYATDQAAKTDDLDHAIDYASLIATLAPKIQNSQFHLIESLARFVLRETLNFSDAIEHVQVEVAKPLAVPGIESVSIRLESNSPRPKPTH